ncbi:MAG: bifunctional tetrahydrofolate synthase/dihydrofolate synthase [Thiotrichales bacterium]
MRHDSLPAWLDWLETLHPKKIDLGLERVREVASRLGLLEPAFPLVSVAGTNGKGSTVGLLQAMAAASGYRAGSYTSPHLQRYNERITIDRHVAEDAEIMRAFDAIDQARSEISLSYFEFGTLAAMWLFHENSVDLGILEVGLGGRLDAVNVWDADVAIITSIGIDHTQWLGDTREQIALEKVAIARSGAVLVCGDPEPPATIASYLTDIDCTLLQLGRDFSYSQSADEWFLNLGTDVIGPLPLPAQRGSHQLLNAATAVTAASCLDDRITVSKQAIKQSLRSVQLPGRFETVTKNGWTIVLDVAHNPQGGGKLAQTLRKDQALFRKTFAIVGMMEDKQAAAFMASLGSVVDHWILCAPDYYRAAAAVDLAAALHEVLPEAEISLADDTADALKQSEALLAEGDRLLVTGSFYTVAELREKLL